MGGDKELCSKDEEVLFEHRKDYAGVRGFVYAKAVWNSGCSKQKEADDIE